MCAGRVDALEAMFERHHGGAHRRLVEGPPKTALALAQRFLRRDRLVDVGERHPGGQWIAVGGALWPAFEARPEVGGSRFGAHFGFAARFAADAPQPQLAGLRLAGLLELPLVPVAHILVRREDEGG